MSLASGQRTASAALLSRMAPECQQMGRSIKTVSMVLFLMVLVAFVLMIVAIIYSHVKNNNTNNDAQERATTDENKKKVVAGLTLSSTVILAISTFVALWQVNVSGKTAKLCLSP